MASDVIRNNERVINRHYNNDRIKSKGIETLKGTGTFLALGGAILYGIGMAIEQAATFIKQIKNKR